MIRKANQAEILALRTAADALHMVGLRHAIQLGWAGPSRTTGIWSWLLMRPSMHTTVWRRRALWPGWPGPRQCEQGRAD